MLELGPSLVGVDPKRCSEMTSPARETGLITLSVAPGGRRGAEGIGRGALALAAKFSSES